MSCASHWLNTDRPRECSCCGPAHAPGSSFQNFSSSSRQGCHYGWLCLFSEWLYLFVVVSKKAMWAHTLDACIRRSQVGSGERGRPVVYPILFNTAVLTYNSASKHDDKAHICSLKNLRALQTAQPGQTEWASLIKSIVLFFVLCSLLIQTALYQCFLHINNFKAHSAFCIAWVSALIFRIVNISKWVRNE